MVSQGGAKKQIQKATAPKANERVFPKNRGKKPKMEGTHNGKPYEQMDDLQVHLFSEMGVS